VPEQLSLPGMIAPSTKHIVNVASVSHRSPFRYPGGKTWLVPRIRQWLTSLPVRPVEFIEPFAGGAIVGLTVAFEKLADHVTLVELDEDIAAVWQTILGGDGEWLANRIAAFDLTRESVDTLLAQEEPELRERAFRTIVRNRVNRGGILAPGAGMLKNGENGKGISSRWYPRTLQKRILGIVDIRERLAFIEGDGVESIDQNAGREDVVYFIDPPYTIAGESAGRRLYKYWELDHEKLFRSVSAVAGDFLMTYENTGEVRRMADQYGFDTQAIAMKNTHHARKTELLIGRSLDWIQNRAQ
jgi:DNA adenine methylase